MGYATSISRYKTLIVLLLIGAGLLTSWQSSQSIAQRLQADQEAEAAQVARRMTSTFMLLLDGANGPLRSLATLFNGSGVLPAVALLLVSASIWIVPLMLFSSASAAGPTTSYGGATTEGLGCAYRTA